MLEHVSDCSVEGGDDKSTDKFYNPLYISDDPFGGYMKLSADERKVSVRAQFFQSALFARVRII